MYFTKLLITAIIILIDHVSSSVQISSNNDSGYIDINTSNDYISEVLRRYNRQAGNNGDDCEIPRNPLFTEYKILGEFETNFKAGDFAKQFNVLEIRCNKGYALSPLAPKRLVCLSGKWSDEPTACFRTCPSLISTETTTVTCRYNNIPLKDCINPIKGTIAVLSCNSLYEEPNIKRNPIRVCKENRWDPPITQCYPVCGIKHPKGVANIVNGTNVQIGDYPWQVGLYYSATREFFCGGSIIDQNIILTAAHCVTNHDGIVQPASNYVVAAGKYYRKYDKDGDHLAQYSSVSAIHVPERYSGRFNMFALDIAILILSNPFTLTDAVQPVCIELNEVSSYISLSPYDEGIVTGWGYTEEGGQLSDALKELIIPFIPFNKCFNEIPSSFKRYFTQDKICGGYKDNATSVCRGDSGGALVFKNIFSDRYFVQGIVSTSPATEALTCDSNQYSLYTYVNNHISFVRDIVAKNQLRKPLECVSDGCANEENVDEKNMFTKGCLLPNMPQHGKYYLMNNAVYVPGNYAPLATEVTLSCNDGYTVVPIDTNSSVCADTGNWQPQLGTCVHAGNVRVVCYYASWAIYRVGVGQFTPENINPHLCTHIMYAFGNFTNDYMFKPTDEYNDITLRGYAKFTGLKEYNKDLKTMLAIGGWAEGGLRFASIAANSTKRSIFIRSCIEYLRRHNFDGLSFDWEFPLLKDRDSYTLLIKELREGYENESKETGLPRLLLTITLPTLKYHINEGYDVLNLTKYVDWTHVITYDYHYSQEPLVNHHSKLFGVDETFDHELNVNFTLNAYLESGVARDKLLLGIPTFGRTFALRDSTMTDIGSPAMGPGLEGNQTSEKGFLAYYEICKKIKDDGWVVKQPYPHAMGPYAYKDNQWVGYDDENIVRKKSHYVGEKKFGGIFIWLIEYDDFRGTCTGKQFPLIKAAKEALLLAVQEQH